MPDVFISYASADRDKARVLAEVLTTRGWSVWWDRDIPPGKSFDEVIEEALDSAKCVLVLWSKSSVASSWVKTEAADAMRRKILVPVLMEAVKIPLEFRRLQAADLCDWKYPGTSAQFELLVGSIHDLVSPQVLPPPKFTELSDSSVSRESAIGVTRERNAPVKGEPQKRGTTIGRVLVGVAIVAALILAGYAAYNEHTKRTELASVVTKQAEAAKAAERKRMAEEQAIRDQAAQERAGREQAEKDRTAKEQADRALAAKERLAKEQLNRKLGAKNQAALSNPTPPVEPSAAVSTQPSQVNLSGNWRGRETSPEGRPPQEFLATLEADGNNFGGGVMEMYWLIPRFPRLRVDGRIEGSTIRFDKRHDGDLPVAKYTGSFDPANSTITGTWKMGSVHGRFIMKKCSPTNEKRSRCPPLEDLPIPGD